MDKKRGDLLKLQGEFAVRLRHLEKALLTALNEAKGSILEDEKVGSLELYPRPMYNTLDCHIDVNYKRAGGWLFHL